jgi:hypothetical protein
MRRVSARCARSAGVRTAVALLPALLRAGVAAAAALLTGVRALVRGRRAARRGRVPAGRGGVRPRRRGRARGRVHVEPGLVAA